MANVPNHLSGRPGAHASVRARLAELRAKIDELRSRPGGRVIGSERPALIAEASAVLAELALTRIRFASNMNSSTRPAQLCPGESHFSDGHGLHPGTDAASADDAYAAEGAAYARALLDRIKAGGSTPGELANLVQFLESGSMLHAACVVIFAAIRVTPNGSACDDPRPGT